MPNIVISLLYIKNKIKYKHLKFSQTISGTRAVNLPCRVYNIGFTQLWYFFWNLFEFEVVCESEKRE